MHPSVTVITPTTANRSKFNERITDLVQNQDYPNTIEHLFDYSDLYIGTKLNRLCQSAQGEIIIRFDSDDIYAANWITRSVNALLASNSACTGLRDIFYHDGVYMRKYTAMRKVNNKPTQITLCGATLCFWKHAWAKAPFKEVNMGEDADFCSRVGKIHAHDNNSSFLATLHGGNTSSHLNLNAPEFSFVNQNEALQILSKF